MSATVRTNTVVIGAGPGGYPCAIRLAQLGVDVVVVEKAELGGVCLNVGCIPSKALISASKLVEQVQHASTMGIHVDNVRVDLREMIDWKSTIVNKLTSGVGSLIKGNGGRVVRGTARFTSASTLVVDSADGQTTITFDHAVIATGSRPSAIPGFAFDGVHVVGSTEALAFDTLPASMAVIGGGYIGMEMGGVYQRLGTDVTVVEYADRILPGFAADLVRPVAKRFKRGGGTVLAKTRAVSWKPGPGGRGCELTVEDRASGETRTLEVDVILMTVGRTPTSQGLGLEALGLATDARGFIEVDGEQRTAVANIFAIGDVAGEPMLAHKATKEGEVAAEVIAGKPAAFDSVGVPAVVFTDPEIASVGLSEQAAKDAGHRVRVGKFSFGANGRALSLNEGEGFVRAIIDADTQVVLGVEAVGPEVSNLIAEAGLALEMGAVADDIGLTIHAHPTLSEAIMEATNAALGHAIHAMNR